MLQKCKPMRQTKCPAVTIVAVVITVQAFSKIFQRQYRICAICKEKKSLVELIHTKFRVKHPVLILTVAQLKAW